MTDLSADALAASIVAEGEGTAKKPAGKLVPTIAAVAVLTLVAIGGGAGVGFLIGGKSPPEAPAAPAAETGVAEAPAAKADDAAAPAKGEAKPSILVKLAPVVTTIASPAKTLLRVEASIVITAEEGANNELLAAQIQGDTLAFMRTLDLAQVEGARGLLHLREDLKERAQMRSPAVTDYLIQSLIAQ